MDPFSLAIIASTFAAGFSGGEQKEDPRGGSGGQDIATQKKLGFVSSNLFRSGATAYTKTRGTDKLPFESAPEFGKMKSVSERTRPTRFTAPPTSRPTGYSNVDIQNAMRMLSNSTNKDIIRLIPIETIQPIKKQTKTIALGSSDLGKIK